MRRHIFIFFAASLAACSPPEPSDTTDSPGTDASTTGVDLSTSTTGDATTEVDSSTSSTSTSTTGDTTMANITATAPTTDDPEYCIPEAGTVTCEPMHRQWCDEVAALAEAHIPATYADIINGMCDRGDAACYVCFNLANICSQVGDECDNLLEICGCLAVAHGVV